MTDAELLERLQQLAWCPIVPGTLNLWLPTALDLRDGDHLVVSLREPD